MCKVKLFMYYSHTQMSILQLASLTLSSLSVHLSFLTTIRVVLGRIMSHFIDL